MRLRIVYVVAVLAGVVCYLSLRRVQPVYSQAAAVNTDTSQFRIVVGLKDQAGREFKGKLTATGAAISSVQGWRFSQNDSAEPTGAFSFHTKMANLEDQRLPDRYYGATDWGDPKARRVVPEGLTVRLRGSGTASVSFESSAGNFSVPVGQIALGARLPVLDGNGYVEGLPVEEKLSSAGASDDYPAMSIAPDGTRWVAWLSYQNKADEVIVSDGRQIYHVSGRGDLYAPAIASDGRSKIHVVWPQNQNGTFQLFGCTFEKGQWSKPQQLTSAGGSNLAPQLASDGKGNLALVWPGFRNNQSVILARLWNGRRWSNEEMVSAGGGNAWTPSVSYGSGKLWIAWDSYATGSYQIYVRQWHQAVMRVTVGDNFCVRPSIVVTAQGKPVVAWEESDQLWGKDFAYIVDRRGTVEYKNRRIRAAYLDGSEWKEIRSPVADAIPAEIRRFVQQPQLSTDASGRLYMGLRCRTSTGVSRIDYWSSMGRWETFVTHLDGDKWAPAILMPSSVGRNSMRPVIATYQDQVHVLWPADNRPWPGVRYADLDIFATALPASGNPAKLDGGAAMAAGAAPAQNPNPNETADIQRVRSYRVALNGKQYRILRGDFHRHTELSQDGAGDGMLEDNYRYTLDAAGMDIGHVADHQMGTDEEYNWWMTQKSNDLYYMPNRFVPMYGYERSVPYPNGHRNVVWAERGKPVLKIGPAENQGKANSGPIVYPYMHETNGIVMSHTSATEQGTDWRDNDPDVEPLVEIYQGYESNYEEPHAPRAWKEGQSLSHQGVQPLGYVWNAWAKGYKLGVESSSDHISTHTSYTFVLAEDFTRQSIFEAMKKRHAYAATDNIVMDFRIGNALMGDAVKSDAPPKLVVKILGTAPVKQVDVVKNNTYIHKLNPNQKEVSFEYVDDAVKAGESYYYIRAEQTDGQLVWSSPIWIRYQ